MRYGAPLIAGALVYGNTDLGVLGSDIRANTATGANGPGILYNDWDGAADDNKRFRALIVSGAPAGSFFNEDGSFVIPADTATGVYPITYRLFVDGEDLGTTTATLTVNSAGGGADTAAPSQTGSLTIGTVTSTSIQVSWPAGSDNVGVTDYETSLDGTNWTSRGNVLTHTFTGLSPLVSYTIRVRAKDAAGNASSPVLSVTQATLAAPDVTLPVMSGSVLVSLITETSYTISGWSATDNVGVVGFELSLDGGVSFSNIGTATTRNVTGRTAGTTDAVRVRAYDTAGNRSGSLAASVQLAAPAPVAPAPPPPPPPTPSGGTARIGLLATGQLVVLLP